MAGPRPDRRNHFRERRVGHGPHLGDREPLALHRHSKLAFSGSIHFITTVTQTRGEWFKEEAICRGLLELFERCRAEAGLTCLGYVLMPDHFHTLLYQKDDEPRVPDCMAAFKKWSAHNHRPADYLEGPLWRRRYDDVPVPGTMAVRTKLEYMHGNPVKAGITNEPSRYEWSSARDYAGKQNGIVHVWTDW